MSLYTPNPAAGVATGYTIPDDGNPRAAAGVNVPIEALADGLAYLKARIGSYQILNAGAAAGGSGAHNWSGNFSAAENLGIITISGLKANDVVELDWWGPMFQGSSGGTSHARLAVSEDATSYTDGAATWFDANVGFGKQSFGDPGSVAAGVIWPIYLSCAYTVVAANPLSTMFVVQVDGATVTGGVSLLSGGTPTPTWGYRYRLLRPNT